jgi:L-threonylcarbamoyladenylate synthase
MKTVPSTPEGIMTAAEAIRAGEIAAYPTESMYGLGVDPFSETAIRKLQTVKQRRPDHPILVIVAGEEQLHDVAAEITPNAAAYMERFWPGPLSLLFPNAPGLPKALTGGRETVCARCPACKTARDLCRAVGHAITSSSANFSGQVPARSLDELCLPGVAVGIDGGTLKAAPPSTVFDPDRGEILREGAISRADLDYNLPSSASPANETS